MPTQVLTGTLSSEEQDALSDPRSLLTIMHQLRQDITREAEQQYKLWEPEIQQPSFVPSAQNLAAYLSLRKRDLRPLQTALMPWGLSSLGRSESRVVPSLDAVISTLATIVEPDSGSRPARPPLQTFFQGERLLHENATALLGPASPGRRVRIMVTLPAEAATGFELVRDLLQRGMNCARINCAHETRTEWEAMVRQVRLAEQASGHPCRILMDLAGPKARTGQVLLPEPKTRLHVGDRILMTRGPPVASVEYPLQVECEIPNVLDQLRVGAQVWIDEGKLGTQVDEILPEGLVLKVTRARDKGERLRSGKGLNFPGSQFQLSPLTRKDREDLAFVVQHADIVGYSFVRNASDIDLLQHEIRSVQEERAKTLSLIIKIENLNAVRNLPELIVHAAGKQPLGVMIARGDLAVEIG